MISKIEAVNYRCLRNVSQRLDRCHVFTGPNGSGKSTFLEVPYILSNFAREGLDAIWSVTRAKSIEEIKFYGEGRSIQLAVETKIPESIIKKIRGAKENKFSHIRYEIEIGHGENDNKGTPPRILAENLWLLSNESQEASRKELVQQELEFPSSSLPERRLINTQKSGWRKVASKTGAQNSYFRSETTEWNLQIRNPKDKSALSTLPEDERFPLSNWFKSELVGKVQKIMLRSELMQSPSSPLKQRRFAVDGSNLPQVIQELRKHKSAYLGWINHLKTVLDIKDIKVLEKEEDRSLYLKVLYETGLKVFSWHLSDGTLRLLALTLLSYIDADGSVYLIEEPENGIHPQAIEAVCQSLNSVYDGQVLATTHSPVIVAQVSREQLLCFSKAEDDSTDIIRGDRHPKLAAWKGTIDLAQLFAAGILS